MPGYVIDAGAAIVCPHGGRGMPVTTTTRVRVGGLPPILDSDRVVVDGCAFDVDGAPSPCVLVRWLMPSTRLLVDRTPVVLSTSTGLCVSATGAPQGWVTRHRDERAAVARRDPRPLGREVRTTRRGAVRHRRGLGVRRDQPRSSRPRMSSSVRAPERAPSPSTTLANRSALRALSSITFSSMVPVET